MPGPNPGRGCGACNACCSYFPIKVLSKPELTPCPRLATSPCEGCGDYENRPPVCSAYKCMWLYGNGEDEDRPDISGVIVDNSLRLKNGLQAKPLFKGAESLPRGREAIRRISNHRDQPVLVCSFPEKRLVRVDGRGCE